VNGGLNLPVPPSGRDGGAVGLPLAEGVGPRDGPAAREGGGRPRATAMGGLEIQTGDCGALLDEPEPQGWGEAPAAGKAVG